MMPTPQKLGLIQRFTGLTQEQLAQKLGVSFVTVNQWLNAKSTPRAKAAKAIDELYLEVTGQKTIPETVLKAKRAVLESKRKKIRSPLTMLLKRKDLLEEFTLKLTYNTNRIEGSTLSENDTADILFRNRSIPNHTLTEQLEAKNHQTAWLYLLNHLKKREKINEALVLKLHSILMNGIRDDAGLYRRHGVRIVGAFVPTANYLKIPDLMPQLVQDIQAKKKDALGHASEIHARFESIHPFADGNGRIGRLLMHAMLFKANFPPALIFQQKKRLYYTYLQKAQLQQDCTLLIDFISDSVLESYQLIEEEI